MKKKSNLIEEKEMPIDYYFNYLLLVLQNSRNMLSLFTSTVFKRMLLYYNSYIKENENIQKKKKKKKENNLKLLSYLHDLHGLTTVI